MLTFVAEDPAWTWHFLKLVAQSQGCVPASCTQGWSWFKQRSDVVGRLLKLS